MQRIPLPHCNLTISRVGLGGCPLGGHGWGDSDHQQLRAAVQQALDLGINFFDTADIYGLGASEELLAEALGQQRKKVVLASKFGVRRGPEGTYHDASPDWMRQALEGTLRRLRIDSLPLYYLHWPDGRTPLADTLGALEQLRQAGKIQAIGLSNLTPEQCLEAIQYAKVSVVQAQYSLIDRQVAEPLLKELSRHGIPLVTWGSLSQGLLTGKYGRNTRFAEGDRRLRYEAFQGKQFTRNLDTVERLSAEAEQAGCRPSQLAVRWLLDTPGVGSVLFGAKSPEQVTENAHSALLPSMDSVTHARLSDSTNQTAAA